jgi:hypothetical protein
MLGRCAESAFARHPNREKQAGDGNRAETEQQKTGRRTSQSVAGPPGSVLEAHLKRRPGMKRGEARLVVVLLAAAAGSGVCAGGGQAWKKEAFEKWTDKDIQEVILHSPWSRAVTVEETWKPLTEAEAEAAMQSVGGTAPSEPASAVGMPLPMEQGESSQTRGQDVMFNVYWMSSHTMRAAMARRSILHGEGDPKAAEAYVSAPMTGYQIAVTGMEMQPFQRTSEGKYRELAWLEIEGGEGKLVPSKVTYQKNKIGLVTAAVFYFPKVNGSGAPLISPRTKKVEFTCKVGESTIHARFDPRKMHDARGQDL